ncbi:TolC family protein [Methylovorus sp. MM2]|uniref:TolC family protein n=1 Tax=Methylovorus sp. MM2 TaxID=1848038 RepID=UPI0013F4D1D4|nr:TolC family protein [Methylovorus sp. MM2]
MRKFNVLKKKRRIILDCMWPMLLASTVSAAEPQATEKREIPASLQAASDAAHAAVEAANAAAVAATAAANAATAAANAASAAVQATAQSIQQLPAPQLIFDQVPPNTNAAAPATNTAATPAVAPLITKLPDEQQAQAKPPKLAPLGLQPNDLTIQPQTESANDVKDLSLSRLFGISMIPVAVTNEVHNEYLDDYGQKDGELPASFVDRVDISSATSSAVEFSRDVHIADERVNQANSQSRQAFGLLLPNLSVRYGRGREISSPSSVVDPDTGQAVDKSIHVRTDKSITLRQPIMDLPTTFDWLRRKAVVNSREESRRGSQADAWLSTVTAYLGLTSSRLIADLSVGYEKQLDKLFEYVDKRASAGASSGSDRERVRARSLSARSTRTQQESAHSAASVEFLRLTNIAPKEIKLPDRSDMGAIPNTVAQAVKIAMANSPDVASLRAEMKAAQIDQNVARTKFAPRFDIEVSKIETNNAGGPVGSQDDTRMMFVMNWNLLNGGSDYHLTNEKRARLDEVRYRLDDLQRRITQSMVSQYATLEATREQLVSGYKELNAISSAASSMSEKMLAGNQSLLDLLDVYDRQYQARVRLVTLHTQEIDSLSQISRLLGQAKPLSASELAAESIAAKDVPIPEGEPLAVQATAPAQTTTPVAKEPEVKEEDPVVITPLAPPVENATVPLVKQ